MINAELIEAWCEAFSGRYNPSDPASPTARLRTAWSEASAFERKMFRSHISEVDAFGDPKADPGKVEAA